MEQLGPRQDLYEEWNEPVVEPAPIPAPLTGYKMKSPPSSEQNIESVPVSIFHVLNVFYLFTSCAHDFVHMDFLYIK